MYAKNCVNERGQVSTYRAKVGKIGELPCREKKYAQKTREKGGNIVFAPLELSEACLWTSNIFSLKEVIFADLFKYKDQISKNVTFWHFFSLWVL